MEMEDDKLFAHVKIEVSVSKPHKDVQETGDYCDSGACHEFKG